MTDRLVVERAELFQVEETRFKMPMSMFGADEALIEANRDWLYPLFMDANGEWDTVLQSWILRVDDRIVVVDPCTGNGREFPHYPPAHQLQTPYIERFEATGIRPEEVDFVFCTHLHMDHCGWNTRLRDGRFVPTFPNARYILVRREYDRWDPAQPGHVYVKENAGTFQNSVLPVVEAGLAQLVPDRFRITESLFIEPAHGHTAGHSLLRLLTGAGEVLFTGDCFHHPLELKYPDLDAGTCEDWAATFDTRRRIIRNCVEKGARIIPAHFPCPFGGFLRGDPGNVLFEPCNGAVQE